MSIMKPLMHRIVGDTRDPHWDKVVSLLHFDGDVMDGKGLIWGGDEIAFSSGVFNLAAHFNGSQRITTPHNDALNLSNSDLWTIEFLVSISTAKKAIIIEKDGLVGSKISSWAVEIGSDGAITVLLGNSAGVNAWTTTSNGKLGAGIFSHVAIVRNGSNMMIFVNGIADKTSPINFSSQTDSGRGVTIGNNNNYSGGLAGLLDELRITKGVARYTESFTPPNRPFPNK